MIQFSRVGEPPQPGSSPGTRVGGRRRWRDPWNSWRPPARAAPPPHPAPGQKCQTGQRLLPTRSAACEREGFRARTGLISGHEHEHGPGLPDRSRRQACRPLLGSQGQAVCARVPDPGVQQLRPLIPAKRAGSRLSRPRVLTPQCRAARNGWTRPWSSLAAAPGRARGSRLCSSATGASRAVAASRSRAAPRGPRDCVGCGVRASAGPLPAPTPPPRAPPRQPTPWHLAQRQNAVKSHRRDGAVHVSLLLHVALQGRQHVPQLRRGAGVAGPGWEALPPRARQPCWPCSPAQLPPPPANPHSPAHLETEHAVRGQALALRRGLRRGQPRQQALAPAQDVPAFPSRRAAQARELPALERGQAQLQLRVVQEGGSGGGGGVGVGNGRAPRSQPAQPPQPGPGHAGVGNGRLPRAERAVAERDAEFAGTTAPFAASASRPDISQRGKAAAGRCQAVGPLPQHRRLGSTSGSRAALAPRRSSIPPGSRTPAGCQSPTAAHACSAPLAT